MLAKLTALRAGYFHCKQQPVPTSPVQNKEDTKNCKEHAKKVTSDQAPHSNRSESLVEPPSTSVWVTAHLANDTRIPAYSRHGVPRGACWSIWSTWRVEGTDGGPGIVSRVLRRARTWGIRRRRGRPWSGTDHFLSPSVSSNHNHKTSSTKRLLLHHG